MTDRTVAAETCVALGRPNISSTRSLPKWRVQTPLRVRAFWRPVLQTVRRQNLIANPAS